MDGASVVWVALMVFLYVEPSLGSRQLPKRATSPPSWLMQSTIVGKTRRRSLCYFSGLLCYFFCQCTRKNLLFKLCCQNWQKHKHSVYKQMEWSNKLVLWYFVLFWWEFQNNASMLFFLKLFVLAILHSFFPTMQPTSSTDIFLSSTSSNGINLTHGWIIMHKFVFSISKHGGGHCTDGRRSFLSSKFW